MSQLFSKPMIPVSTTDWSWADKPDILLEGLNPNKPAQVKYSPFGWQQVGQLFKPSSQSIAPNAPVTQRKALAAQESKQYSNKDSIGAISKWLKDNPNPETFNTNVPETAISNDTADRLDRLEDYNNQLTDYENRINKALHKGTISERNAEQFYGVLDREQENYNEEKRKIYKQVTSDLRKSLKHLRGKFEL